ncbi:hypothetical protein N8D77_10850 [Curtobacterium flaccumfaciens]|uniref:hypothetical protein n=1 Tax=Curtobacterium flaccumfaciens TaxID=2035 RepID=UPI0021C935F0|nr:hypothetical protein [Curtobacterium flaccumfaciens]UXN20667.1 hypothetical protein N8D77_10850 [Curtobacterium flaccumfaciens pv. flaccumfaciens]
MNETESVETVVPAPPTGFLGRLRFRWRAEQEIHELTRDRELEERCAPRRPSGSRPGRRTWGSCSGDGDG